MKRHDGGQHGGRYEKTYELSDTFAQQLDFFEQVMKQWDTPARNLLELRMEYETPTLTPERVVELQTAVSSSLAGGEPETKFFGYLERLLKLKKPGDEGVADNIDLQNGYYALANHIGTGRMAAFRRFVERCVVYDENLREYGVLLQPGQRLGKRKAVTQQTFFESVHWLSANGSLPEGVLAVIESGDADAALEMHSDFREYPDLAQLDVGGYTMADIQQLKRFYSVENFTAPYFFGILCFQGKSLEEIRQVAAKNLPFRPETYNSKYIIREISRLVRVLKQFGSDRFV